MPYIPLNECQRLGLLPGSKLTGTFGTQTPAPTAPHLEDRVRANLCVVGTATQQEFLWALRQGIQTSVWEGFDHGIAVGTKELPPPFHARRSIVTLQVAPSDVELVVDTFKPNSIRVHFTDSLGHQYRFVPLTDLGFHRHVQTLLQAGKLRQVNDFINAQAQIYLRVGLARPWAKDGRQPSCWLQVNGVYTFPNYTAWIRSYT